MQKLISISSETPIRNTLITTDDLKGITIGRLGIDGYKSDLNWSESEKSGFWLMKLKIRVLSANTIEYIDDETGDLVLTLIGKRIEIPTVLKMTNSRIDDLYELSASCLIAETSSSSPSMLLHQLVSLMLIDLLPWPCLFEEVTGSVKPDLVIKADKLTVYLDVTSDIHSHKRRNYDVKNYDSLIIVNKYSFKPMIREIEWLRILSSDCDKKTNFVFYDMICKQAKSVGSEMLYSKKTIDYFTFSEDISEDCDMLNRLLPEKLRQDKSYLSEPSGAILFELKERLYGMMGKISPKARCVRGNYCFPLSEDFVDMKCDLTAQYVSAKTFSEMGRSPDLIDEFGKMSYSATEKVKEDFFYMKKDKVRVHVKAYDSYVRYPGVRLDLKTITRQQVLAVMKVYKSVTATYDYIVRMSGKRVSLDGDLAVDKNYDQLLPYPCSDHIVPDSEPELLPFYVQIDPDHMILMKSRSISNKTIRYLARNRDYHEARFKKKIVSAIKARQKDGTKMMVRHWAKHDMYAEVLISGLIFSDEKGVAYVSYFIQDKLYRTELWRLSDIENYESLPERMITLILSTGHMYEKYDTYMHYLSTSFRLMMENSWGASRWLKPLRYLSSGLVMGSSLMLKTLEKVEKEMKEEDFGRRSIYLLFSTLMTKIKDKQLEFGKTLFFSFDFVDIGYECFLYDLCPKKTYGRKRHLRSAMNDMIDEVELYDKNYLLIKELYLNFEDIIEIKDRKKRYLAWSEHLDMINRLSLVSNNRFTFSPASIVLLFRRMSSLATTKSSFQGTVPKLSDLATAKASYCSVKVESKMACESIVNLATEERTNSTSRLAIKLVHQRVDLIMRMFDKPQVGGNREISILSGPFRVLQSILESYGRRLAEASSTDILDRPDKFGILSNAFTEALMAKDRLILTADQTRWGPNFSTVTFGLMYLITSRFTTEYYMPALSCLLCEFKAFELPIWIPDLFVQCNTMYTIPGVLGRSHMGQGIFHRSSSLYHSYVLDSFSEHMYVELEKDDVLETDIACNKYCTSDDMVFMVFLSLYRSKNKSDADRILLVRSWLSKMPSFLTYFCIKTSDYKNLLSKDYGEMNSWYFSREGLGSNDLKFINSLVEAQTSGNFLRDFQSCFTSHENAINSGCSNTVAESVFYGSYLMRLRQWKMTTANVGIPDIDRINEGFPAITKQDQDNLEWIFFPTVNNFKRRGRIQETKAPETKNELLKLVLESNLSSISGSIGVMNYKNMIVRQKDITMSITPINPTLNSMNIYSMTYESFLFNVLNDIFFIHNLCASVQQPHMIQTISYQSKKIKMFGTIRLKTSYTENLDPLTFALSSIKPCLMLRSGFDHEDFISHIYRSHKKYDMDELRSSVIDTTSFNLAYLSAKAALDDFSLSGGGVVKNVFVPAEEIIEYRQITKIPVGIPHDLSIVISLEYGYTETPIDMESRYVSSETTTLVYCHIDLINIRFSNPDDTFYALPAKLAPNKSSLIETIPQLKFENLLVYGINELAFYEFMYQVSHGLCKLVDSEPKIVFLNYSVQSHQRGMDFAKPFDHTDFRLDNEGVPLETMSAISSKFGDPAPNTQKTMIKENALIDYREFDNLLTDDLQRAIMNAFNMTVEDEEIDEHIHNVETITEFDDGEEFFFEKHNEFIDMLAGNSAMTKRSISSKSVAIDWRFIIFSNTFTLRRVIFLTYLKNMLDKGIALSTTNDPLEAARLDAYLIFFDGKFSKLINQIMNSTIGKMINTAPDPTGLLSKIRTGNFDFKNEDLSKIPFVYSVSGKPKNIVVSRGEFEDDYDHERIMI
jgi:hypothetical protein